MDNANFCNTENVVNVDVVQERPPGELMAIFRWFDENGYYHRREAPIAAEGTPEEIEKAIHAQALVTVGEWATKLAIEYGDGESA